MPNQTRRGAACAASPVWGLPWQLASASRVGGRRAQILLHAPKVRDQVLAILEAVDLQLVDEGLVKRGAKRYLRSAPKKPTRRMCSPCCALATSGHAAVAPPSHPVRQRTGVPRQGGAGLDRGCRCQDRLHRAGQPLGNGYIKSFNASLRDELLNGENTLREAQIVIESCDATTTRSAPQSDTSHQHQRCSRPHSARGRLRYARPRWRNGQP